MKTMIMIMASLFLGVGLLLAACGSSASPTLSTAAGEVRISGADSDAGFPPGCAESDCQITVEPGEMVIVWLEVVEADLDMDALWEDCEENAVVVAADGQSSSCFMAGVLDDRTYLIFPVAAPSATYMLQWGDNAPVEIVP